MLLWLVRRKLYMRRYWNEYHKHIICRERKHEAHLSTGYQYYLVLVNDKFVGPPWLWCNISSHDALAVSQLAIGSAFEVTFGIPGLASVTEKTEVTGTTVNQAQNTYLMYHVMVFVRLIYRSRFTTQGNNLASAELWLNEPYNSSCQGFVCPDESMLYSSY
jgi:hypothetical protein